MNTPSSSRVYGFFHVLQSYLNSQRFEQRKRDFFSILNDFSYNFRNVFVGGVYMSRDLEKQKKEAMETLDIIVEQVITTPNLSYKEVTPTESYFHDKTDVMRLVEIDKEDFTYVYPRLDEREESLYRGALFNNQFEQDLLPYRGYYHYLTFDYKQKLFGILEHGFQYDHLDLKVADGRFFNHNKQWNNKEILMYMEEESSYIEVPVSNKKHELSEEYNDRVEKMNQTLTKLEKISKESQMKFKSFYRLTINKDESSVKIIKSFVEKYLKYIKDELPLYMKLHLAYSNVDIDEYLSNIDKLQEIENLCEEALTILNNYDDRDYFNQNYEYHDNKIKDFDAIVINPSSIVKKMKSFKTGRRDEETVGAAVDDWKSGYIGYDLDKMKLFPNPAEIERRRSRKNKPVGTEDEKYIQRRYLIFLKDSGAVSPKKEPADYLFIEQEVNEIKSFPYHLRNKKIFEKGKKKGWSLDKILREVTKF